MSDLFHEKLGNEEIAAVFGVMAACPQHTFQVLTKRPERMARWFRWLGGPADPVFTNGFKSSDGYLIFQAETLIDKRPPLPNVWLGVSVEDQDSAERRIPLLLQTPAAVRFVSYEPALGPVDFSRWIFDAGEDGEPAPRNCKPGIDWLIVGGESGPGARPCDVEWVRSAVKQARAACVPVFVKQLGANPFNSRPPIGGMPIMISRFGGPIRDRKGGDPAEWPAELRVREMPQP